uniref:Uncharacterized protein n=1 Tax=Heterorhabditis bacteriophora TaxID=37862 RepID=A0A1I7W915_HETBA
MPSFDFFDINVSVLALFLHFSYLLLLSHLYFRSFPDCS